MARRSAVAVLLYPVDATLADATASSSRAGPAIVSRAALAYDATVNDGAKIATKLGQLAAVGIIRPRQRLRRATPHVRLPHPSTRPLLPPHPRSTSMNAIIRNPFDAGGYSLAEMTQAINILPNLYTRLGQIGLFRFEGVTQRSVIIEQYEGVLNLLPSVPLGAPATVGTREGRSMRSFALPWIPHDDVILPSRHPGPARAGRVRRRRSAGRGDGAQAAARCAASTPRPANTWR